MQLVKKCLTSYSVGFIKCKSGFVLTQNTGMAGQICQIWGKLCVDSERTVQLSNMTPDMLWDLKRGSVVFYLFKGESTPEIRDSWSYVVWSYWTLSACHVRKLTTYPVRVYLSSDTFCLWSLMLAVCASNDVINVTHPSPRKHLVVWSSSVNVSICWHLKCMLITQGLKLFRSAYP